MAPKMVKKGADVRYTSPTHQLPPAIAIPIANPGLSAPFRNDNRRRDYRFEDGADGGLAYNGSVDRGAIDIVVAQGLHLPLHALAGTSRVRGGAAEQQKGECDKDRGHADLVTIPRVGPVILTRSAVH
jgi:hypothetical protein